MPLIVALPRDTRLLLILYFFIFKIRRERLLPLVLILVTSERI